MSTRITDASDTIWNKLYHFEGKVKRKAVLDLLRRLGVSWLM